MLQRNTWTVCCLLLLCLPASAASLAQEGSAVVNCHDEALGTVQKLLAQDCKGKVVGEAEADQIREQRRQRIRSVLARPSRPGIEGRRLVSVGSGFFVSADGSVVTNRHVVAECGLVTITPAEGEMAVATAVITDSTADLAVLHSDITPPAVATFRDAAEKEFTREPALLIGYPNRGLVTIEPVVTAVEVVDRKFSAAKKPHIVIKGQVRSGNSGGPVLDASGLVIGVVFAKINSVKIFQLTGKNVRDIGMAISREAVFEFLDGQGVNYRESRLSQKRAQDDVLEGAKPYLAQIRCWN